MLELARFRGTLPLFLAAAAAVGCGDDVEPGPGGGGASTVSTGGSGGVGGLGGSGGEGGTGGEATCLPTDGVTLALTELYFGQGTNGEWKNVGLNIDGLVSDGTSTDVCQPAEGGDPDVAYPDGEGGIDNSFGKNLLPLILSVVPTWPDGVNAYLEEGRFNAMLKMYCLPPTGDVPVLITKVFGGTELGSVPAYDGTDVWPVVPEILGDPQDPESSTLVFENSSVIGSTFDSGTQETFILTIPIEFNEQSTLLKLTLYGAQVTMTLSEDRKSATGGVIGGVLNTEEIIAQVSKVVAMADLCDDALYDQVVTLVRQSSDIMSDGTQDPGQICDGISFGVRFEMQEVQLGDVGPEAPPGVGCP